MLCQLLGGNSVRARVLRRVARLDRLGCVQQEAVEPLAGQGVHERGDALTPVALSKYQQLGLVKN